MVNPTTHYCTNCAGHYPEDHFPCVGPYGVDTITTD